MANEFKVKNGIISPYLAVTGSTTPTNGLFLPATNSIAFSTNSSETMRIDASGNVGIGASSPGARLDVTGGNIKLTTANAVLYGLNNATNYLKPYNSVTNGVDLSSSTILTFITNSSERMRITSTGNVGIGITPSAWSAGVGLQFGTYGAVYSRNSGITGVGSNQYFDGTNYVYLTTNKALDYRQDVSSGAHSWYNAASGTAATTITFTQAMTLDSSGNLGVGGTPSQRLDVYSASAGTTARFRNTNAGNFIDFYETNTSTRLGYVGTPDGTNWNIHNDKNGYMAFDTNNTERMRIDSSGNVGIGITSPGSKLAVNGYITESIDGTNYYNVVTQRDVGTNANQIPLNQYLGSLAYQNYTNAIVDNISIGSITSGTSGYKTSLSSSLTADRSLVFPDVSGTLVTTGDTGSVTNTMLAGSIAVSKISATGTASATTYLRGDGSWSAVSGMPTVSVVSATSQSATTNNHYVLTNAAATTVTLPASPTQGDLVWITVANSRTDNVVARNGNNIMLIAQDLTIDISNSTVRLRYIDSTRGWMLI